MHDYPRVRMSLFLRLCIWSYVAFVRVAGLSCSTRTVDREIRLSLPSREVGTRRKLNEKKKKKKATNRNLYDIYFFSFLRESRSRLKRDNVVFVEKISVKIVIMRMSLKKFFLDGLLIWWRNECWFRVWNFFTWQISQVGYTMEAY